MNAFDTIAVGDRFEFGSYEFTADRIKAFARDWDPQPIHTDEAAAAKTSFGGLIASGWHTASVMMRLQVDHFKARGGARPSFRVSPGFDDLKWLKAVRPGDRITYGGRVLAKRLSRSRPGMGIVTTEISGTNQDGEPVFVMTAYAMMAID